MLLLTRKVGEAIVINSDITLTILEIRGNSVKLGFDYSNVNQILRKEVFDRVQQENKTAAACAAEAIKILDEQLVATTLYQDGDETHRVFDKKK